MFTAAASALSDILSPPLRRVLLKSIGLALLVVVLAGVLLQRLFSWLAQGGVDWAEASVGFAPHGVWTAIVWIVSIMASLGIITGALFLMPAVTALVGSFFVDEVAEHIERSDYPADAPGRALPVMRALVEGIKVGLLALVTYMLALPFLFFGIGFIVLFFANAFLLSREYFELAAMRFRPPLEAKAMRKRHGGTLFAAGMIVSAFVSIPVVNFATPVFAMAFMVHLHKRLSGPRPELIEPSRVTTSR